LTSPTWLNNVAPPGADRRPRAVPGPHPECRLCPRLAAFREANRKAFPGWHSAPVASLEHRKLCEEPGCEAYFTKPVSARAFLEAVQDWSAREHPERRLG
jgi:hypothetical protein